MGRFLLTISFLGSAYHGWQVQPNGITVQEELQNALQKLFGERPNVTGCSRTDAGVHANMFCCHFDANTAISEKNIVNALNFYLPNDIAVKDCKAVENDFHARYSCKGKNYIYRIYNSPCRNPFEEGRSLYYNIPLDTEKMNEFCQNIVGTYDFTAFSSAGTSVTDFVRTVTECTVERKGEIVELSVSANGFLYNMVRIITGSAILASSGKLTANDALRIINSKDRSLAGPTASPEGLYLNKVFY